MKASNCHTTLPVVLVAALGIGAPGLMAASPAFAANHATASTAHHKLSDAQIAAVVVGANTIDINNGKLALKKSHDPEVRQFAQDMVRDHSAINKAAKQLVTKLGVTPEPSNLSPTLGAEAKQTMAKLSNLHGKAFDRAYINNEVAFHK